jgi:hypothetical protein
MIMNMTAKIVAASSAKPGVLTEPGKAATVKFQRHFGTVTLSNHLMDLSFLILFAALLGTGLLRFFWAVWQVIAVSHGP